MDLFQEEAYYFSMYLQESKYNRKENHHLLKINNSSFFFKSLKFQSNKTKKDQRIHSVAWTMKWLLLAKGSIIIRCIKAKMIVSFGHQSTKDNLTTLSPQLIKVKKMMILWMRIKTTISRIRTSAREYVMVLNSPFFGPFLYASSSVHIT